MNVYLAEEAFAAPAHGEGVVDVHVVVLGIHGLFDQGLVDLWGEGGWVGE